MVADDDKARRLVVFDVEGVLLPERRYLFLSAMRKLGILEFLRVVTMGILYEIKLLSLESAFKRVFKLFKGVLFEELLHLFREIPLIPGTIKVFKTLNESGYKTALISSGLPTSFVKDLASRLKADYAFGLELETKEGYLTGEVFGDALKPEGKAMILRRILEDERLSSKNCIVVVDDRNNLPMFSLCGLRIGYNPDFVVSVKSDFAIKGELSDVLSIIMGRGLEKSRPVLSHNEVIREMIHMSGFFTALIPWAHLNRFLNRYSISLLIFLATGLYIASEFARMRRINLPIFSTITWRAATHSELYEIATDPAFFALGVAFSLIIFPEPTCYASIAILTLGDSFATIFGKILGRSVLPFNKSKRLEGSVFGLIFAFLGSLFFVSPTKALVGAVVGMLAESLPLPISDNLVIPFSAGLALLIY